LVRIRSYFRLKKKKKGKEDDTKNKKD